MNHLMHKSQNIEQIVFIFRLKMRSLGKLKFQIGTILQQLNNWQQTEMMYTVEKIFGKKIDKESSKILYHVKWSGYPFSQSTWQPQQHLKFVKYLIDQYNQAPSNLTPEEQEEVNALQKDYVSLPTKHIKKQYLHRNRTKNRQNPPNKRQTSSQINQDSPEGNITPTIKHKQEDKNSNKQSSGQQKINKQSSGQQKIKQKPYGRKIYKVIQPIANPLPKVAIIQADKQNGDNFKIIGVCRRGNELVFYVNLKGNEKKWIRRQQIIQNNPVDLIKYYEKHLNFITE